MRHVAPVFVVSAVCLSKIVLKGKELSMGGND